VLVREPFTIPDRSDQTIKASALSLDGAIGLTNIASHHAQVPAIPRSNNILRYSAAAAAVIVGVVVISCDRHQTPVILLLSFLSPVADEEEATVPRYLLYSRFQDSHAYKLTQPRSPSDRPLQYSFSP